ncbi:MAG TPA: hypothetical protein VD996_02230 [Chitinophagaceae bacterium]|nr:hypothetical protein [Chitinophagaceae bacterium]
MKQSLVLLIVLLSLSAQSQDEASEKWFWSVASGKTNTVRFNRGEWYGYSKPQMQKMYANISAVLELVHQTPRLNPPKGFEAAATASICEDGCYRNKVLSGHSILLFRRYYTKPGVKEIQRDVEGPGINFYFNDIRCLVSRLPLNEDEFFPEPKVVDTIQGFPVYPGSMVVITKNKKPLFDIVTKERYLQSEIKRKEKDLEELKKKAAQGSPYRQWLANKDAVVKGALEGIALRTKGDPAKEKAEKEKFLKNIQQQDSMYKASEASFLSEFNNMINKLAGQIANDKAKLASMSQQDRSEAAMDFYGERRLVTPSKSFFNDAIPASEIQVIVINFNQNRLDERDVSSYGKLFREIYRTIDLKSLLPVLK